MDSFLERLQRLLTRLQRRFFRFFSRRRLAEKDAWNRRLVHSLSRTRLPSWRQVRHLPEVLSTNDNLRLQIGALLVLAGLAIFGVQWYYAHTEVAPIVGGSMTEGVVGVPHSLNPVLAVQSDVDLDLTRLIYSSLYATDKDGNVVPDLVETETVSTDQKTYTLKLREAKWHDDRPVTASDVIFTLSLIQDPAWKSPLQKGLSGLTATKIDDRTVRLAASAPFPSFRALFTFGILPEHVWKSVAPADALTSEANLKPIGSGPFAFDQLERDGRGFIQAYSLKRNDEYYVQPPYLERLRFQFYPDSAAALDALKRHDVDSLSYVARNQADQLKGLGHVTTVALGLPQVTAVFFNGQQNSALKDRNVRRALAMSTNKGRLLLDVLHGEGRTLDGLPLPSYVPPATNAAPTYDLAGAAALFDAAGWKLDKDGLRKKTEGKTVTPLVIRLTVVDQPESLEAARVIEDSWSAAGVTTEIDAVAPADAYAARIQPRNYEALLYGQLFGIDGDPYPYWHSTQVSSPGLNLALFANRQADLALEAARTAVDPAVRAKRLAEFRAVMNDQVPAVFLYSPTYTYPLPTALKGFGGTRINIPADRFATITGWYLKTGRVWKK